MKPVHLLLITTTALMLASCGGGGGGVEKQPTPEPKEPVGTTLSGKVIDGYIQDATVCLDLNNNFSCDANEPSAVSGNAGSYSFTYDGVIPSGIQILADIPVGAFDEDRGAVTKSYNMMSPAENPDVVTPLTTLVSQEILSSGNQLTAEEAEASVKVSLGFDDSTSLLDNDFFAGENEDLKDVAVSIATALAVTKGALENDNVASTELTPAEISKAAIKAVKETVVSNLIVNGIPMIAKDQIANEVTTAITGQVKNIVASTKSGDGEVVSLVNVINNGEFILLYEGDDLVDSNENGDLDGDELYNLVAGIILEFIYFPGATEDQIIDVDSGEKAALLADEGDLSGRWLTVIPTEEDYILTDTGWKLPSEFENSGAKIKNNCATFYDDGKVANEEFCFVSKDISGKTLEDILPGICEDDDGGTITGCNSEATIPDGSIVYDATKTTPDNDYGGFYSTWYETSEWKGYVNAEGDQTIAGFIAEHTDNRVSFLGERCNTAFRIKSYDSDAKTGTIEWTDATRDHCNSPFSFDDEAETETLPFEIVTFGGTEIFKTRSPIVLRSNNPGDDAPYITFSKATNAYGFEGIYGGGFTPSKTKLTRTFTGNLDYGVFVSKTFVDFVFEQVQVTPFPYDEFLNNQ